MAKRKKRIPRKSVIKKLPVDSGPSWFLLAAGALACGVIIFTFMFNIKAAGDRNAKNQLKATSTAYYEQKDMVRPTFLPTPTASVEVPDTGPMKIPIIMYHYVEYVQDPKDTIRRSLNVPPSLFEAHLKSFQDANFESYFMKDVPDILSGSIHYDPNRSVVLTFDDGYEDFYADVFPLLKRYHMRATLYVIYDFIGRPGFITKDQIQELINSNLVEIGSHTLDHLYLKSVSDQVAEKQIIDSKKDFEDAFHIRIATFAYPYGAMSPVAIADVKKAGYTAAVSVIPGTIQSEENLFFLSRIRPGVFGASAAVTVEHLTK